MKAVIPVSKENKYRLYLTFLKPIIKCTKREVDVLSLLMSLHYTNRDRLGGDLKNLILAPATRKALSKHLNMTIYQYNNIVFSLRKKGLIVDNQLNNKLTESMNEDYLKIDISFVTKS